MTNPADDASVLTAIRQALEAAENAGDAEAAAALMTDDVVVMVPDFGVMEGNDACAAFMRDMMGWTRAHLHRHIAYDSAEVHVAGDMAFDRGTFSFTVSPKAGADQTVVTGKYLWLLRRTAAAPWRIARLIVSRDDESGAHEDGCAENESSHEERQPRATIDGGSF